MPTDETNINILEKYKKLADYSKILATEKNHQKLLELILKAIKSITCSDGGTLYLKTNKDTLKFEVVTNTSLKIKMGGTYSTSVAFPDLPLYEKPNIPNLKNISCYSALTKEVVILSDAYSTDKFNFLGTKTFDKQTGYRTKSVLTIPLINLDGEVIGVTQLINAKDNQGETVSYSSHDVELARILASHASITLNNLLLYKNQEKLFSQFAESLATAIDSKSSYTEKHCELVSDLSMMICDTIISEKKGFFRKITFNDAQRYEMKLATTLHDCGKVSTPTYIMDKATKLETVTDRIDLVRTKFEVLKRDAEISLLKEKLKKKDKDNNKNENENEIQIIEQKYKNKIKEIDSDVNFLLSKNIGAEFMSDIDIKKVEKISEKKWHSYNNTFENIINSDELENLTVKKGTLTDPQRELINKHAQTTWKMLDALDFPKHLRRVPEIASAHHEKLNGKGYPRGLKGDEIPLQARILGIADVFEALTSKDRPYKKAKTLSQSLFIVGKMVENNELDAEVFKIFLDNKIYLKYSEKYLDKKQIDDVDITSLPGYYKDNSLEKKAA